MAVAASSRGRRRGAQAPGANGSALERLPDGRGAPGREQVGEIQRARILGAMTELVRERGVPTVTVAHIVGRSGVSRRTFYELFEDRGDCLLAAFEQAVERAAAVVLPAYEGAGEDVGAANADVGKDGTGHTDAGGEDAGAGSAWEERIRAGLAALLRFLDREPALGRLCVVDALGAEREVLERRARVVEVLIAAVHQGGARSRGAPVREHTQAKAAVGAAPGGGAPAARPARIVAEGAVGAVLAVIHARLREPDAKPLSGLLNQLMGMIVLPYLGVEAAARQLRRPAPRPRRRPAARADPLRELDMRLTYRTVRVLLAIAELGGRGSDPSSREVADASGVADQGQMSKLLWRLEHLGLIANGVQREGKGEANAWSLTPRGREVEHAIRAQTGG